MTQRFAFGAVFAIVFVACASTGWAVTPEVTAGLTAAKAAPQVFSLARDLASIPADVGQTLLLPLGVVETVLSPLPGLSLAHGARNIGTGLKGPFDLLGRVLKLPLSAVNAAAGLVGAV